MSACKHTAGCDCSAVDVAVPTPMRQHLIEAIEGFFMHRAVVGGAWPAADLADDLISKGLFVDERRWQ